MIHKEELIILIMKKQKHRPACYNVGFIRNTEVGDWGCSSAVRAHVYMQVPEEARRQHWSPWSWSTPVDEPSSVDAVLIITELSLQPYISVNSEEFKSCEMLSGKNEMTLETTER